MARRTTDLQPSRSYISGWGNYIRRRSNFAAVAATMKQMVRGTRTRAIKQKTPGRRESPPRRSTSEYPEHRRQALQEAADHLSEAANRLHEVDMHELADQICEAAEDLRRQADGHKQPPEAQPGPDGLEREVPAALSRYQRLSRTIQANA